MRANQADPVRCWPGQDAQLRTVPSGLGDIPGRSRKPPAGSRLLDAVGRDRESW